jgi:L-asparagine transporter-like permease
MSGTTPGGTSREKLVHRRKVAQRRRVAGVLYRVLLIMGILAFPFITILILFTVQFRWWAIFFPTALILLGVLLAWYEYRLYKRL